MNTFITTQTASTHATPSRKQAIEDGALIDLSDNPIIKLHWTIPFACTFGVWFTIQANLKNNPALHLCEILRMLSISAKIATMIKPRDNELGFDTHIGNDSYRLILRTGPDDNGERAATLGLINEF